MNANNIRIFHQEALTALQIIYGYCSLYHINFFLRGGSCLGAVKYHGFVPVDEDIDIAFPREEYDRLLKVVPFELGEDLLFVYYGNYTSAHSYAPQIILKKNTCLRRGVPLNHELGRKLIDIFPIDGLPDSSVRRNLYICKFMVLRAIAGSDTVSVKERINIHKRWQQNILLLMHFLRIHKIFPQNKVYAWMDSYLRKYPFGTTNYVGILISSKGKKDVLPARWFGDGVFASFENFKLRIPVEYDLYLKRIFGDDYLEKQLG